MFATANTSQQPQQAHVALSSFLCFSFSFVSALHLLQLHLQLPGLLLGHLDEQLRSHEVDAQSIRGRRRCGRAAAALPNGHASHLDALGGVEKRASVVVAVEQAAYQVSGNGKLIGLLFCFNFIYCIANPIRFMIEEKQTKGKHLF